MICRGGVIGSNPLPDAIGSLKQKQLGAMPDCFVVPNKGFQAAFDEAHQYSPKAA